jgi:hypothetical protein
MKRSLSRVLPFVAFALALALAAWAQEAAAAAGPAGVLLAAPTLFPFPVQPELQAVAIGYRNQRLIGYDVLPVMQVGSQEYGWYKWDVAESYSLPDTKVGRTSAPNRVQFHAEEKTSRTEDHGLDDPIPMKDIEEAPDGVDPRARAVEGITDYVELGHEKRTSDLVFGLDTYPSANRVTLSGSSQFNDYDNSDPLGRIADALNQPLIRPNTLIFGQRTWTIFRQHPKVVKAVHMNAGDSGMASREAVADLLEVDAIYVGESRLNVAAKGQAPNFERIWGPHLAMTYIDSLARPTQSQTRVTFGFTARYQDRIAGTFEDNDIGLRGGEIVRSGESVDEKVCAPMAGYFIQNAVSAS